MLGRELLRMHYVFIRRLFMLMVRGLLIKLFGRCASTTNELCDLASSAEKPPLSDNVIAAKQHK